MTEYIRISVWWWYNDYIHTLEWCIQHDAVCMLNDTSIYTCDPMVILYTYDKEGGGNLCYEGLAVLFGMSAALSQFLCSMSSNRRRTLRAFSLASPLLCQHSFISFAKPEKTWRRIHMTMITWWINVILLLIWWLLVEAFRLGVDATRLDDVQMYHLWHHIWKISILH